MVNFLEKSQLLQDARISNRPRSRLLTLTEIFEDFEAIMYDVYVMQGEWTLYVLGIYADMWRVYVWAYKYDSNNHVLSLECYVWPYTWGICHSDNWPF
jgi:hypothetical protein